MYYLGSNVEVFLNVGPLKESIFFGLKLAIKVKIKAINAMLPTDNYILC